MPSPGLNVLPSHPAASGTLRRLACRLRAFPPEAGIWIGGLTLLALVDPAGGALPDLCLLHRLGITWCPGCGLGRSVAYVLQGSFSASVAAHPLGIPALFLLAARALHLLRLWLRGLSVTTTP